MTSLRLSKIWLLVALCSLLIYVLYWVSATFDAVYDYILRGITVDQFFSAYFLSDVLALTIGILLRFVGVLLALVSVYIGLDSKGRSFLRVKKKIALAVFLKGHIFFCSCRFPYFILA